MGTQKNEKFDSLITGVVYDFMGWLTSRPDKLILSSSDNAAPAAEVVLEFLNLRGIDTISTSDEMIHKWPFLRNKLEDEIISNT